VIGSFFSRLAFDLAEREFDGANEVVLTSLFEYHGDRFFDRVTHYDPCGAVWRVHTLTDAREYLVGRTVLLILESEAALETPTLTSESFGADRQRLFLGHANGDGLKLVQP